MASIISVRVVDDLDGSEAVTTVEFGWKGGTYELDVSAEHAEELAERFDFLASKGRRVDEGRRPSTGGGKNSEAARIRSWARDAGVDVPRTGRVPESVVTAYREAVAA